MVLVGVAAKGVTRVEDVFALALRAKREVKVVSRHPLGKVGRAHVLDLLAQCVCQVKRVDAQLVGHCDVAVVRHALGNPVVAAHGLKPPDLVDVREGNAVHLVGAIALEKLAQDAHAVASGARVGQHQRDHVLLANAAGLLGLIVVAAGRPLGGTVDHHGIRAQDALV